MMVVTLGRGDPHDPRGIQTFANAWGYSPDGYYGDSTHTVDRWPMRAIEQAVRQLTRRHDGQRSNRRLAQRTAR